MYSLHGWGENTRSSILIILKLNIKCLMGIRVWLSRKSSGLGFHPPPHPHHWSNKSQSNSKNTQSQGLPHCSLTQLIVIAMTMEQQHSFPIFWQKSDHCPTQPFRVRVTLWRQTLRILPATQYLSPTVINIFCRFLTQVSNQVLPTPTHIEWFGLKNCQVKD